jgi:hypothetical protein
MDLISNIKSIQNKLSGQNPNKGKGKPASPKGHPDSASPSSEEMGSDTTSKVSLDSKLGYIIDTTA